MTKIYSKGKERRIANETKREMRSREDEVEYKGMCDGRTRIHT